MREKERQECGGDAGAGGKEEDHRCSDGGHPQGWCDSAGCRDGGR